MPLMIYFFPHIMGRLITFIYLFVKPFIYFYLMTDFYLRASVHDNLDFHVLEKKMKRLKLNRRLHATYIRGKKLI